MTGLTELECNAGCLQDGPAQSMAGRTTSWQLQIRLPMFLLLAFIILEIQVGMDRAHSLHHKWHWPLMTAVGFEPMPLRTGA
jgi:hypothetical protein